MFAPAGLATAESPNGCPRITSSDTATDFTTLLKMIYFPGFVVPPACHQIPPLITVYLQIPRTGESAGFLHIFVPPPDHVQV